MIDIEGIAIHKLLVERDLDSFSKLKSTFFSTSYTPLYREINKFYLKHGNVPSFSELEIDMRDATLQNNLLAVKEIDAPDEVSLELAVDALVNRFAQNYVLNSIDKLLDQITILDVSEVKETLGSVLLDLDNKLHTDENIVYADQVQIFREPEETNMKRVPTGISNDYDAEVGGFYDEELILIGGKRGQGKSVVCANLVASQYQAGKTAIYYTIEMTFEETFQRMLCILAGVSLQNLRRNTLSPPEELALVRARAGMFLEADDLVEEYSQGRLTSIQFEQRLTSTKSLKPDNQIIVVDDRQLSLPTIDLSIQKFTAQFGDNLSLVVIDYLNQIVLEHGRQDMYDWKDQLTVSKQLKQLARKYGVPFVSPYQIDKDGEARFSKAILDACDIAFILSKEPEFLKLTCVKARSVQDDFVYAQPVDWDTLIIDPATIDLSVLEEEEAPQAPRRRGREVDDI